MRISDWSSDVCSSDLDSGTTGATAVAIIAGLLLPVSAYFVHEWGHLSGALASGSRVHFPRNAAAVFLFRFDVDQNDRRQFLAMSAGGYIASIVVVALLLAALQLHYIPHCYDQKESVL